VVVDDQHVEHAPLGALRIPVHAGKMRGLDALRDEADPDRA
jgi:hypothetical protein